MPGTNVIFFFDSIDWCLATAVYTTNKMDVYAPAGYYQFNNQVRYFNGTKLSACQNC